MSIIGIESLVYGVDDIALCTQYLKDFGLALKRSDETEAVFELAEGSSVYVRSINDSRIPNSKQVGFGVREVIWGVDTQQALTALVQSLSQDREVSVDSDGTARFFTDGGLAFGLRQFTKKPIVNAPAPTNAPGMVCRLNTPRPWRTQAIPKTINHIVFAVPDFLQETAFFQERLGFKLSDYQHNVGVYLRADGTNNHHSLLAMNASMPTPGMDGQLRFHHANFGVCDLDELMIGVNNMERAGWPKSHFGLGRHRIDSALFCYLPCPAGGEIEYGTDADYVDDTWVPREWPIPLFAYSHWVQDIPPFLVEAPAWEFRYLTDGKIPKIK
ncbi:MULTISPECIES: VOC family protein [Pseudomonas]|uniref:Glyoxalase n=3 Tax=Pseudomonas gessardii TaxID=78544 RepID=A0ABS9FCF5_9PSED|nr:MULTISPECIES: VOC family protein [Pseudomonas]MBH3423587.1 VOC family protein [Pseudomonas gessardii]MCF5110037.1 glyoxalase [Pseudomonas gessardii]NNA67431.1 glyoxalase [Pseudomonas gessardii]PHN61448.1 glyoxalase [Pseudomonas sp. ICMP 8385]